MKRRFDCPSGGEADTALLYLAGRLSEADAAAFEEHYFSCPECREDVARGGELRAMLGRPPVVAAAPARRLTPSWLALAAAAAIAVIGLGVFQLSRQKPEPPASGLRAGHEALDVRVAAGPRGGFELTWSAPSNAASYRIEVFGADGATLWTSESREPRSGLDPEVLPKTGIGPAPMVRVEAFDAMGQLVAKSEPVPLVGPGGKP